MGRDEEMGGHGLGICVKTQIAGRRAVCDVQSGRYLSGRGGLNIRVCTGVEGGDTDRRVIIHRKYVVCRRSETGVVWTVDAVLGDTKALAESLTELDRHI